MPMRRVFTAGVALTLSSSALAAPPTFTAAQSKAGQVVYVTNCQGCHGNKLQGSAGSPLAGTQFLKKWSGKKVDDLYYITHTLMPLNKPNSLTDKQYLNVVAYILQANGIKPGTKPMTAVTLKTATITKK
jgi:mono/diheme cytochrome c family protein